MAKVSISFAMLLLEFRMPNMRIALSNVLLCVLAIGFLASCSDIGIVKRRYRPGFHVDAGTKEKVGPTYDQQERNKSVQTAEPRIPNLFASVEKDSERLMVKQVENAFKQAIKREQTELGASDASAISVSSLSQTATKVRRDLISMTETERKWSLKAIVAFSISLLGLILLLAAIFLLIHGATLGSSGGEKIQQPGYRLSIATLALGLSGFVLGFFGLKDVKSKGVKSKAMAILAIVFGAIVLAISLIPALIFLVIIGGG